MTKIGNLLPTLCLDEDSLCSLLSALLNFFFLDVVNAYSRECAEEERNKRARNAVTAAPVFTIIRARPVPRASVVQQMYPPTYEECCAIKH